MRIRKIWMAAAAAALLAAPAAAQQDINETAGIGPGGKVSIDNLAGSVIVTAGSGGVVEVTGTLGKGSERLEVEEYRGGVRISVILPDSDDRHGRHVEIEGSDLEIRVPSDSALEIETVSADIEVRDISGGTDIESVSGRVRLYGRLGKVDVDNVSGSIEVDAGAMLDGASFESVSGNIECRGDLADGGRYSFDNLSGRILLEVPRGFSAEWSVETFSGDIDNEIGPEAERDSQYAPGRSVRFTTGSGSGRVDIDGFSGKVTIRES